MMNWDMLLAQLAMGQQGIPGSQYNPPIPVTPTEDLPFVPNLRQPQRRSFQPPFSMPNMGGAWIPPEINPLRPAPQQTPVAPIPNVIPGELDASAVGPIPNVLPVAPTDGITVSWAGDPQEAQIRSGGLPWPMQHTPQPAPMTGDEMREMWSRERLASSSADLGGPQLPSSVPEALTPQQVEALYNIVRQQPGFQNLSPEEQRTMLSGIGSRNYLARQEMEPVVPEVNRAGQANMTPEEHAAIRQGYLASPEGQAAMQRYAETPEGNMALQRIAARQQQQIQRDEYGNIVDPRYIRPLDPSPNYNRPGAGNVRLQGGVRQTDPAYTPMPTNVPQLPAEADLQQQALERRLAQIAPYTLEPPEPRTYHRGRPGAGGGIATGEGTPLQGARLTTEQRLGIDKRREERAKTEQERQQRVLQRGALRRAQANPEVPPSVYYEQAGVDVPTVFQTPPEPTGPYDEKALRAQTLIALAGIEGMTPEMWTEYAERTGGVPEPSDEIKKTADDIKKAYRASEGNRDRFKQELKLMGYTEDESEEKAKTMFETTKGQALGRYMERPEAQAAPGLPWLIDNLFSQKTMSRESTVNPPIRE